MSDTFGPYTPVRRAGELYFVSGQVGVNMATKKAKKDIIGQTRQALLNLKSVLATAELDLANVVKVTIFLTNMDEFVAMNEVYETFFEAPRPARSTIEVKGLPQITDVPLLVELEAVAIRGNYER